MKARPDSDYEDIYLLKEPITFKLMVNDELLEAEIVSMKEEYVYESEEDKDDDEYYPDSVEWFTIKFSNGHSDDYCIGEKEMLIYSGPNEYDQDEYTDALQPDICWPLEMWSYSRSLYTLRWPVHGKETNIWIFNNGSDDYIDYYVVFNCDYRFSILFEEGQWIGRTHRKVNPEPIDEALANKVISLVKYYHIQPPEVIHLPKLPKPTTRALRITSDLPKTYQLAVPITFIITVQGELLVAKINTVRYEHLGYEDDCDTWIDINWFNIKFSNGHEDEYRIEYNEAYTNKGQDKYCSALHKESSDVLEDWEEDYCVYSFGWPIDGIESNIWVHRVGLTTYFDYFVYHSGHLHFLVKFENDEWTTTGLPTIKPKIVDEALAKKVVAVLKHYHKGT